MKIAVIPDIHGTHWWEKVVPIADRFDKVIFLGDYFDTWDPLWPDHIDNAYAIWKFKKENADKVNLLWANHDISYYLDERCSGFQFAHEFDIKDCIRIAVRDKLLQAAAIYDDFIFTHAGVSKEWMRCAGISDVAEINDLFIHRPNFFRWVGPNGYGDNINEGPFWIRPNSLLHSAVENWNQVIGHTENIRLEWMISQQNTKVLCIDSPMHSNVIELDTLTKAFKLI
jgi:hypothetical protein